MDELPVGEERRLMRQDDPVVHLAARCPFPRDAAKVLQIVRNEHPSLACRGPQMLLVGSFSKAKFLGMNHVEAVSSKLRCKAGSDVMVQVDAGRKALDGHNYSISGGNVSQV